MTCIHYGSNFYDPLKFKEIGYNHPMKTKPSGGLWGTWNGAEYGWQQWCIDNEFKEERLSLSFLFYLAPETRILELSDIEDLDMIPTLEYREFHIGLYPTTIHIDWFELMKTYDVVKLNYSNNENLWYRVLYGWDCDSVLVMNKDVLIVETEVL